MPNHACQMPLPPAPSRPTRDAKPPTRKPEHTTREAERATRKPERTARSHFPLPRARSRLTCSRSRWPRPRSQLARPRARSPRSRSPPPRAALPGGTGVPPVSLWYPRFALAEERTHPAHHRIGLAQVAFPNNQHAPARAAKFAPHAPIAGHIARELRLPEGRARSRCRPPKPACMPVPEASMHKDHGTQAAQHDVRLPRQVSRMQPKPKPQCMHHPPHGKLRRRVAPLHGGHAPRALLPRERVDAAANSRWMTRREHDKHHLFTPVKGTPNCIS